MKDKKENSGVSRRQFLLGGFSAAILAPKVIPSKVDYALNTQDKKGRQEDSPVTEDNIEGPFYRANAPFTTNLRDKEKGDVLFVSGKVDGFPGKEILEGAIVDVWQADNEGHYDNEDEDFNPKIFRLRGRMKTDDKGMYSYETIVPKAYNIGSGRFRPSHIHYKVSFKGFVPLTTQLYFKGDAHIAKDPFVRKSLIMDLKKIEDKDEIKKRKLEKPFYTCVFNITLKKLKKESYGDYK